jgi:hypothetical protein
VTADPDNEVLIAPRAGSRGCDHDEDTHARARSHAHAQPGEEEPGRFAVCEVTSGPNGRSFRTLRDGFVSLEEALRACPHVARRLGIELDDITVIEAHDFWDHY